jgi:anthranilate synthase component 2
LSIARYHSLVATSVPNCLQVIAQIADLPMAILHQTDNMLGFQFHPETVLSSEGSLLLQQAMQYLVEHAPKQAAMQADNKEG